MHLNYKWKLILRVKKETKNQKAKSISGLTNSTNPILMHESCVNCSPKIETNQKLKTHYNNAKSFHIVNVANNKHLITINPQLIILLSSPNSQFLNINKEIK